MSSQWPVLAGLLLGCASDPCGAGVVGMICPVAGTGEAAFNGDERPWEETSFYLPSQVRRGPDGLLYVMDFNNHRLRRLESDGTVSTFAGDGFHAGAVEGAPAVDSSLENPIDFDFLPDGRVVFVSYHDPRVLVVETDGTLTVISGSFIPAESTNDGDRLPAIYARFIELTGIEVGPDGTIYIVDGGANRVRVIRDGTIDTFAGTGASGYEGDGGPAVSALLDMPTAIEVAPTGDVYIADSLSNVVRKVTPDGVISTVAGTGLRGFAGDGGPALDAALAQPNGVAIAADGSLYIGDRLNCRVRMIAPDGTISTVAGTGERGLAGDNGPALEASLGYVSRVQLDADGGLLIVDQTNNSIRKVLAPQ